MVMQMKKIVNWIKKNWYFLLFAIPFVNLCIANKNPTNDIWFLLNNGRYVLHHWIPYVDPFTIHEGLNYVMQQWLTSVIFYGIYAKLGGFGLLSFTLIYSCLIMFLYYRLCYFVSKNKLMSVIVTCIVFVICRKYFVFRPQLFTYTVFLLELLCMEKYIKSGDYKKLIWMPFLSLLLINMHASMWLLQFVFMLPVLCNCIKIKGITVDKIKFKPLLITMIIMLLVGFINPYGYKAITFVFDSYNIPEINELVTEMMPITLEERTGKLMILSLLGMVVLCNYFRKNKLDIRHILFLIGTALLGFMHDKCVVLFMFYAGYVAVFLLQSFSFKEIKNKYLLSLYKGVVISSAVCLLISFVFAGVVLYKNYDFKSRSNVEITDYILKNYNKDEVILFTDYDYGGYTEFMGLKSYMDPRAELFNDKLNKKENIIREALLLDGADDSYYEKFIEKYNFTHLIINSYLNNFIEYMNKNDNYVLEYEQKSSEGLFVTDRLYVRKDVSIK